MAAPYGEDSAPDAHVGVDDRLATMQRYVDADREYQERTRSIKEMQERAEKARLVRDEAKQQIVQMLGLELTTKLPGLDMAEQGRRYQSIHG
jgi:hypothetical protein